MDLQSIGELIQNLAMQVKELGSPVKVREMDTIELLDVSFDVKSDTRLDLVQVRDNIKEAYIHNKIDFDQVQAEENDEYKIIHQQVKEKWKLFEEDINSRQVVWSSDWCISYLHFMIRDERVICIVHFRSSDVYKLLGSDLLFILTLIQDLQQQQNIEKFKLIVHIDSLHIVLGDEINV